MRTLTRITHGLLAVSLGLALAACGSEPTATEIEGSGSDNGSGSGSGSGIGSGSGSGSGTGIAAAEKDCDPINEDLEADAGATVEIDLIDYAFEPEDIEVAAGVVTFATSNKGTEAHEFAVLPGGGEVPLTEDGAPDEEALAAAGAFELEAYGPDRDCNATWDLEEGDYTLFCIVEAPDGETHAEKGMVGSLTVTS